MKKINYLIILFSAVYIGLFLVSEFILSRQVKETERENLKGSEGFLSLACMTWRKSFLFRF